MMIKKSTFLFFSKLGFIPAILYCIPALIFLLNEKFTGTWLLYLGNALFLAGIFILGFVYANKKNKSPEFYNGFKVTVAGVILSCIFVLLLILVFAPQVYNLSSSHEVLQQTPGSITSTNQHGLLLIMISNTAIGNFCAGTFAALMARATSEDKKLPS